MTDTLTKEKRSWLMSRVKGSNTRPERLVFGHLRRCGIHFQRHYRKVTGSPDIAVPRKRLAVFINGDFWHGRYFKATEKKLTPFWREKIRTNMERDRRNLRKLKREGWTVLNVWTGDLLKKEDATLRKVEDFLSSGPLA